MTRLRLIAAAVLATGVLGSGCWFGGSGGGHHVVAYFHDVGDLVPNGAVQLNDVKVGSIEDIRLVLFDGEMVARVEMSVDPSVDVPSDGLRAVVRQTSLLGEQFVQLVPTSQGAPFVGARHTIPLALTERRVDVETFLSDLSAFIGGGGLEDLNQFVHAQALILQDRGARLGATIDELERFTDVLASRRIDVASAISHLSAASRTLADNRATVNSFLDSLERASGLLAGQGDRLHELFRSLSNFGSVNARFLGRHEGAITRQFKALRPVLDSLAGEHGTLRRDLAQLRVFLKLFPKSFGGGPGGEGLGDYVQADAILCETLSACHTHGEKGDVPGQGS